MSEAISSCSKYEEPFRKGRSGLGELGRLRANQERRRWETSPGHRRPFVRDSLSLPYMVLTGMGSGAPPPTGQNRGLTAKVLVRWTSQGPPGSPYTGKLGTSGGGGGGTKDEARPIRSIRSSGGDALEVRINIAGPFTRSSVKRAEPKAHLKITRSASNAPGIISSETWLSWRLYRKRQAGVMLCPSASHDRRGNPTAAGHQLILEHLVCIPECECGKTAGIRSEFRRNPAAVKARSRRR